MSASPLSAYISSLPVRPLFDCQFDGISTANEGSLGGNITNVNSLTTGVTGLVARDAGTAVQGDGVSMHWTFPHNAALSLQEFTLISFVNFPDTQTFTPTIVGKNSATVAQRNYLIYVNTTTKKPVLGLYDGTQKDLPFTSYPDNFLGQSHCVIATVKGGVATGYVDGITYLVQSGIGTLSTNTSVVCGLRSHAASGAYAKGVQDRTMIFNYALTSTQAWEISSLGLRGSGHRVTTSITNSITRRLAG